MAERLHTRFQICNRHAGWFAGMSLSRRAECFVEGGPGGMAGCRDGVCRLWPGRDMFVDSLCHAELQLDWTVAPDAPTSSVTEQMPIGWPRRVRAGTDR